MVRQAHHKRVLSGVQPTGNLHLGNYLGAIRNWVAGQSQPLGDAREPYDNYFFIADLHAITVPHDPKTLAANTYSLAALYLACGIDLTYTTMFVQSHVPAHTELTWLFNCITPLNWLERMIQFKEKALRQAQDGRSPDNVSIGLLDYPVLQAADILLYQPDLVPVGEDQKQHLELTRDIAMRLNFQFGPSTALGTKQPILKIPEPLIRTEGARVMSLTDGTRKMSKSDPSELSRINLLDSPEQIRTKIKRCKTDPVRGLAFDDPGRPECHNLLTLYMLLSTSTPLSGAALIERKQAVAAECQDMGWGQFKPLLTEVIIEALKPIQDKYQAVTRDLGYLESVLRQGRERAQAIADQTLNQVREALGFTPR